MRTNETGFEKYIRELQETVEFKAATAKMGQSIKARADRKYEEACQKVKEELKCYSIEA